MNTAYKIFNKDLQCRGYQYEIGKTYKHKGKIGLCSSGFHFCQNPVDLFNYYNFDPSNRVCVIEFSGDFDHGDDKSVCSEIKIVSEIKWDKLLTLVNTGKYNTGYANSGDRNSGDRNSGDSNSGHCNSGHWNSGDWNSGDSNSGHCNSGDWNSGDSNSGDRNSGDSNSGHCNSGHWNSGDWNSGHWNSGDRNSGFLNTNEPTVRIFNKDTNLKRHEIEFPDFFYFDLCIWISESEMTDEEKKENPNFYVTQGYLKTYDYKEAWKLSYERASESDKKKVFDLPNFDAEIFYEITGIDLR